MEVSVSSRKDQKISNIQFRLYQSCIKIIKQIQPIAMRTTKLYSNEINESLFDTLLEIEDMRRRPSEEIQPLLDRCPSLKNKNSIEENFVGFCPFDEKIWMLEPMEMENIEKDDIKNEGETRQDFIEKIGSGFVDHNKTETSFNKVPVEELKDCIEEEILEEKFNFDSVFKQKKIKGGFKKNTNVPKFIVRIFMKHFSSHAKHENSEILMKHHKKIKKELSSRPSNNYTISDVLALFRDPNGQNEEMRVLNQKIMASIIKNTLQDEVVENKYIKNNHMSYMLAMKLFAIRCRSKTLTERVKIF